MQRELVIEYLEAGKEFVLYQAPKPKKAVFPRLFGLGFLTISFLALFLFFAPWVFSELNYFLLKLKKNQTDFVLVPKVSFFGQLLWLYDQDLNSPVDWQFGLLIPKIGVNTKITAQVDPGKPKDYEEALKGGVAQAKNTAFPNQEGTVYLFGHSSAFFWSPRASNRVFALLPKLEEGDQIILFFEGRRFVYQVVEKKITSPSDVAYFLSLPNQKRLVLQTCWPLGTDWQRYVVVAQIQEEEKGDVL